VADELFDVQLLASLMSKHDLTELDLSDGSRRLRIRRGVVPRDSKGSNLIDITSPGPGAWHGSPTPGEPPYVTQGSRVEPETVIGEVVDVLGCTELHAGCAGVVVEILVANEQRLEMGQVLMRVDPDVQTLTQRPLASMS
jgi:acetyl-CoA carboxylase biotin carboxyl carrier protein